MTRFGMIMYVGIVFGICYLMFGLLFYKSRKAISIHLLQMCVIILLNLHRGNNCYALTDLFETWCVALNEPVDCIGVNFQRRTRQVKV